MASWQALYKSLMYIKNSKGPRSDPWGTPHVVFLASEMMSFTLSLCARDVKYDLRKSWALPLIPYTES